MLYTNGSILMADSAKELNLAANTMNLPKKLFEDNPFPHYKLDSYAKGKVKEHEIRRVSMAEMVYRYYDRNSQ